jgi:DNA-directed RNA polymerase specialized sigma subunit
LTKKKKNNYFTQEHEDAVIKYSNSDSREEREELYLSLLEPAFNEMIDKIVFTYKFTTLPNIEDLKAECKAWLPTILEKFDPSKGSKAFSYFSVIVKNWFIHKIKKNAIQSRREVPYDNMTSDLEHQYTKSIDEGASIHKEGEFWASLLTEMEEWEQQDLREADLKVLNAIKMLLENIDSIEIFNKKAVYMYLREITKMNTKQVVGSLTKMRKRYYIFKHRWDDGQI